MNLLQEAESYIFGTYVSMLEYKDKTPADLAMQPGLFNSYLGILLFAGLFVKGKHFPGFYDLLKESPEVDRWKFQDVKQKLLPTVYNILSLDERINYNDNCDYVSPIKRTDTNLGAEFFEGAKGPFYTRVLATKGLSRLKQLMVDFTPGMPLSDRDAEIFARFEVLQYEGHDQKPHKCLSQKYFNSAAKAEMLTTEFFKLKRTQQRKFLHTVLDYKDSNGYYVIDEWVFRCVQNFNTESRDFKYWALLLKAYAHKHPKDPRFSKINQLVFLCARRGRKMFLKFFNNMARAR